MTSIHNNKAALTSAIAALADCPDRATAAKQLARLFADASGASAALVYLFAHEDSSQLVQSGASSAFPEAPQFADEMGLMTFAQQAHCELIPIAVRQLAQGHVLLTKFPTGFSGLRRNTTEFVAAQSAIAMALLAERERSTRAAMKDPSTNAYTFAYFLDVADREIEKARRHGRRFAIATITPDQPDLDLAQVVDLILDAIRATDVLARADDRELYLLMPETGGVGAQTCRRRLLRTTSSGAELEHETSRLPPPLTVGVATYPHDGSDLSRLLRAAKRRADASNRSVVRTLQLDALSLPQLVDRLLAPAVLPGHPIDAPDAPRPICLSTAETVRLALTIVSEALRGGPAFVTVAHHPEFGVGSSVRTTFCDERARLTLNSIDLRGVPDCANLQFFSVIAEHGAYVLVGRIEPSGLRAVHASDPSLVDLVALRACQAVGVRLLD